MTKYEKILKKIKNVYRQTGENFNVDEVIFSLFNTAIYDQEEYQAIVDHALNFNIVFGEKTYALYLDENYENKKYDFGFGSEKTRREMLDIICLEKIDVDEDPIGEMLQSCNHLFDKSASQAFGEFFTPVSIVKEIINKLNPKAEENIYDPFCGSGRFLIQFLKKHHYGQVFGNDIIIWSQRATKLNLLLESIDYRRFFQNNIKNQNSLALEVNHKYDIVATNIPFSLKYGLDESIVSIPKNLNKNDGNIHCILHCCEAVKEGGKMAIIVPSSVVHAEQYTPLMDYLKKHAEVETVDLKSGTFKPYSDVNASVLYLNDCSF